MRAPFSTRLRVYYQHTDAGGVVYHANYLSFMEAARMELLAELGIDVRKLAAEETALFMVYSINIQYHRPALVNDLLTVTADVAKIGRVRMEFDQRVLRGEEELVTARVLAVCVHPRTLKPIAVPAPLCGKLGDISREPPPA